MTINDQDNKDLKNEINDHIFTSIIKSNVEMQKDMISEYKKLLKELFLNVDIEISIPLFNDLAREKITNREFSTTISFKDMKLEKELCFLNGMLSLEKDMELNVFKESVLLNLSLGEISESPSVKKRI